MIIEKVEKKVRGKRRAKGPNPLSMKKKKKLGGTLQTNAKTVNKGKRRRRKKRVATEEPTINVEIDS